MRDFPGGIFSNSPVVPSARQKPFVTEPGGEGEGLKNGWKAESQFLFDNFGVVHSRLSQEDERDLESRKPAAKDKLSKMLTSNLNLD